MDTLPKIHVPEDKGRVRWERVGGQIYSDGKRTDPGW